MKALSALFLLSLVSMPLVAQNQPHKKPRTDQAVKAALGPAELALAERVYVGHLPCELGASVTVEADARMPGYFHVRLGKLRFHMAPIATTTGAIRLEDRDAGAVWLELANKSMMVSDKLGRRLVDACMSPAQVAVAQAMEKSPRPSVLDAGVVPSGVPGNAVALTESPK